MSDFSFDKNKIINAYIGAENSSEDSTVIARISTNKLNRNNLIINQLGGDYTNYLNNPVVLPFHESDEKPIGLASDFQITENQTVCKITFNDTKDGRDFNYLYKTANPPQMRAFSIGLMPIDFVVNEDETINVDKWELLEISCVSIPADPSATVLRNCINNVKSVKLKKEFERQLFEILINDVKELRDKVENDSKYDELNEKLDYAFKVIEETKNQLKVYEDSRLTNDTLKIEQLHSNITNIKNDYKKLNNLLEAYK